MKKKDYLFSIVVVVEIEDGNIEITETGDVLEEMALKKHLKTILVALLGTKKDSVAGKTLLLTINIEENSQYYDRDETFITVNEDVTDYVIADLEV